jgi:predicted membrane protein (TIGR00267 family)
MANFKRFSRELKDFWRIAEISEIAMRYFVMNIFDDVLMVLGILLVGFLSGISSSIIITTTLGAAIAVTVSGTWGAYMTESAERRGEIKKLERKISLNLKKSPIAKAHRFATIILALVNGLPPILIALLIISPFSFALSLTTAYYTAIAMAFLILFFIGTLLGRLSKENLVLAGIKMILVGVVCSAIIFIVQGIR